MLAMMLALALGQQAPQMTEPPVAGEQPKVVVDGAGRVAQPRIVTFGTEPPGGWARWPDEVRGLRAGSQLDSYRGIPWGATYEQAKALEPGLQVTRLRPFGVTVAAFTLVTAGIVDVVKGEMWFVDDKLTRVVVRFDASYVSPGQLFEDLTARYGRALRGPLSNALWQTQYGSLQAEMVREPEFGLSRSGETRVSEVVLTYMSATSSLEFERRVLWSDTAWRRMKL